MTTFISNSAPFSEEYRAWMNGFVSGLTGIQLRANPADLGVVANIVSETFAPDLADDFPWHDSSLPIVDRMDLAEGQRIERRLMAAMAQLDCGSCGYECETYSQAIASGEESNLGLCSPGGKETRRVIKRLLDESDRSEFSRKDKPKRNERESDWSRKNPLTANLIESRPLNQGDSAKDTRHVAIDLQGSGLKYSVGDALGVYPTNCPELVRMIIEAVGADANDLVTSPLGNTKPLVGALGEDCCLRDPSDEFLELAIDHTPNPKATGSLQEMLRDGVPEGVDVLDVLQAMQSHASNLTATEMMRTLEPLNPRLYSIASSMKVVGDQVHLTVGKVSYERAGRERKGVASTMFAERMKIGQELRVFVQPNHRGFTVPRDPSTPMIMVGPGTGIAPFMAFLQERQATKAGGQNWLFFGDQKRSTDFLYEEELRGYCDSGLLTKLETAFSRDGQQKVYVQHRMLENATELWRWFQAGSCFYVCGDASRMAKDVHQTLIRIVAEQGEMSAAEATAYVQTMLDNQTYIRDVY